MRTLVLLLVLLFVPLTHGAAPAALAEDDKPEKWTPFTPHAFTLLLPLTQTVKHWQTRRVNVIRISVFEHGFVSTLRAPDPEAARWATEQINTKEAIKKLLQEDNLRIATGVLRAVEGAAEIDMLFTLASHPPVNPQPSGRRNPSKLFERAAFSVSMQLEGSEPLERREIKGVPYLRNRLSYKPASAYQFLALIYNVLAVWASDRALIHAAHWQAAGPASSETKAPVGPSVFEILEEPEQGTK